MKFPRYIHITNTNQFVLIQKIKLRHLPFFIMLLLFVDNELFSQEVKLLEGQIIVDTISPANIHVVNLDLEQGTTSNTSGAFKIYVEVGNRLLFSSVQFENKEIVISQTDVDSSKIKVKLFPARNELDEVQISDLKLSGYLDSDLSKIKYFDREKYGIPYPKKTIESDPKATLHRKPKYYKQMAIYWGFIRRCFFRCDNE